MVVIQLKGGWFNLQLLQSHAEEFLGPVSYALFKKKCM